MTTPERGERSKAQSWISHAGVRLSCTTTLRDGSVNISLPAGYYHKKINSSGSSMDGAKLGTGLVTAVDAEFLVGSRGLEGEGTKAGLDAAGNEQPYCARILAAAAQSIKIQESHPTP